MEQLIQAVYEQGVFKPLEPVTLREGQTVTLAVEANGATHREPNEQLVRWSKVYEGLTEIDISEVEQMAMDRSRFLRAARDGD